MERQLAAIVLALQHQNETIEGSILSKFVETQNELHFVVRESFCYGKPHTLVFDKTSRVVIKATDNRRFDFLNTHTITNYLPQNYWVRGVRMYVQNNSQTYMSMFMDESGVNFDSVNTIHPNIHVSKVVVMDIIIRAIEKFQIIPEIVYPHFEAIPAPAPLEE
jgi:hypothetical protein